MRGDGALAFAHLGRNVCGDDESRAARSVLGFVVVPLGLKRDLADDRHCQRRRQTEHAALDLLADQQLLDQHLVVVGERQVECAVELVGRANARDADARAETSRLDEDGKAELGLDARAHGATVVVRADQDLAGDVDAGIPQGGLAALLVHRQRGTEHAGANVRHVEHLEQALHRAVFAEGAVQHGEHHVAAERTALAGRDGDDGAVGCRPDAIARDRDAHDLEARGIESCGNALRRAERHVVLRGAAAAEHGDAQALGH